MLKGNTLPLRKFRGRGFANMAPKATDYRYLDNRVFKQRRRQCKGERHLICVFRFFYSTSQLLQVV